MREDVIVNQLIRLLRELGGRLRDHPVRKYRRLARDMEDFADRLRDFGNKEA